MRHRASFLLSVALLLASSCDRSAPSAQSTGGAGAGRPKSENASDAGGDQDAKPIALTDARLDKYLAFRREYNLIYAGWAKDAADLGKSVDSKGSDLSKGITAVRGAQQIGEKNQKEVDALRAKHGFAEEEDDRLWSAISEIVAAKATDNPLMADSLKSFREMQARGGDDKKAADELMQHLEDQEKQGLAEARSKYGAPCVDLLSKRSRELAQFQADSIRVMNGQPAPDKQ